MLSIGVQFQLHTSQGKTALREGGRAFPPARPQRRSHPVGQQHTGGWAPSCGPLRAAVGLGEAAVQLGQAALPPAVQADPSTSPKDDAEFGSACHSREEDGN